MLYSCGALAVIPSLIQLIEPTRQISKVPLHTTNIRNEHAYYTCISQVKMVILKIAISLILSNRLKRPQSYHNIFVAPIPEIPGFSDIPTW
jgi:hypothetical protein